MLIKSVRLRNIRSYHDQLITLPEGSVLLSGDIGSGKSSILLAIEFALFGVRKPGLTGGTLLRKGSREGSVELCLELDGKEVTIRRNLKKAKHDIKQEAGYIIRDGARTEGTAIELRSQVFEMLGYPQDLLSKHRDIIYRYTVYTPQEEMKAIILEDRDARLNTLRKVFGVDKYKRIRENCIVYIRELKSRRQEAAGRIYGLEDKQKARESKAKELEAIKKDLELLLPKLKSAGGLVEKQRAALEKIDEELKQLAAIKTEYELCDERIRGIVEERQRSSRELERLEARIKGLSGPDAKGLAELQRRIPEKEGLIDSKRRDIEKLKRRVAELETEKKASAATAAKIAGLSKCPMCEQDVKESHKQSIRAREGSRAAELETLLKPLLGEIQESDAMLAKSQQELKALREHEKVLLRQLEQQKQLSVAQADKKRLEERQLELKKQAGDINTRKSGLAGQVSKFPEAEKARAKAGRELESLRSQERELELSRAAKEQLIRTTNEQLSILDAEIQDKLAQKGRAARLAELQQWLEEHFIGLSASMERHIMSQLHRGFSECFVGWFTMLIEDESLAVRLDDEFTPLALQNGYDTELESLSGGERTSVALAYRLALNKVINDFISHIKTRDIIILDEPTDGFSSDQLDRLRDVLEQLHARQVIIVSHESKIESFVENVIRLSKTGHVSSANI